MPHTAFISQENNSASENNAKNKYKQKKIFLKIYIFFFEKYYDNFFCNGRNYFMHKPWLLA